MIIRFYENCLGKIDRKPVPFQQGKTSYQVEVRDDDGSVAPSSELFESVEVDPESGEIQLIGYGKNLKEKSVVFRVIGEFEDEIKKNRIASAYIKPLLIGQSINGKRLL